MSPKGLAKSRGIGPMVTPLIPFRPGGPGKESREKRRVGDR